MTLAAGKTTRLETALIRIGKALLEPADVITRTIRSPVDASGSTENVTVIAAELNRLESLMRSTGSTDSIEALPFTGNLLLSVRLLPVMVTVAVDPALRAFGVTDKSAGGVKSVFLSS